jgi:hypothetical protein
VSIGNTLICPAMCGGGPITKGARIAVHSDASNGVAKCGQREAGSFDAAPAA